MGVCSGPGQGQQRGSERERTPGQRQRETTATPCRSCWSSSTSTLSPICLGGYSALVPLGCRGLPAGYTILQPLLPLPARTPQQTSCQLANGGVLVYRWSHFLLLHSLPGHAGALWGLGGRGAANMDRCLHCCWGVWPLQ